MLERRMNHWKPRGNCFAGDCMPFYRDGVFHLYYLLDVGHHRHPIAGTLGGHQYAHATSSDLVTWRHEKLALTLDFENGECSNCTGSILEYRGSIYAFYALRSRYFPGEAIRIAVSTDGGFTFRPWRLPELPAPPDSNGAFRDPMAFIGEDGLVHLLISSGANDRSGTHPVRHGEVAHYTTEDLIHYRREGTLIRTWCIPECCDYFRLGGLYYYTYNLAWETHVRCSEYPFGPWRIPPNDVPASRFCAVMKTAQWKDGRRIGAGWVPTMENGVPVFGGRLAFREVIPENDGSLGTKFVDEMLPDRPGTAPDAVSLRAENGLALKSVGMFPNAFRLDGTISFAPGTEEFGLALMSRTQDYRAYLAFHPSARTVSIGMMAPETTIRRVAMEEAGVAFRLVRTGDVFDLEIDGRRTMVSSLFDSPDSLVSFYASGGAAEFRDLKLFTW